MVGWKNGPNKQKGPKCNIENHRPIANLCSSSKIKKNFNDFDNAQPKTRPVQDRFKDW